MHAGKDRRRSLRLLSMRGPPDSMAGDECASRFGELTVKEALHIHCSGLRRGPPGRREEEKERKRKSRRLDSKLLDH